MDREFKNRTSQWTLTFLDPAEEARYQAYADTSLPMPMLFKAMTVVGLMTHVLYRVYAIVMVQTSKQYATAALDREVGCLVYILGALVFEAVLRYMNWLKPIHGFVIYTALPIVAILIAFSMQATPSFGVA